ncbi:MAG: hypothetical protein ACOX12_04775 [Eggerthellaceae bacterium]|jgi:hypothetical protein
MSANNLGKNLAIAAAIPAAAIGAVYGGLELVTRLYTNKSLATPEEQAMTLPGDDLVTDPYGDKIFRVTQAMDLDAPLEEVWKHIYQMDPAKGGMYSFMWSERLFGMNVDNAYSLEEMWQGEDGTKPGDFWAWSYAGFGAEVADLVPNKYIVWYANTEHPTRTPGASYMLAPGLTRDNWNWTIALIPKDGGKRCRIISRWNTAYHPHTPLQNAIHHLTTEKGGMMQCRRMFENLEKSANVERKKSIPLQIMQRVIGRSHGDDDRLQYRIAYPELRWSRDFPRVATERAPFTDDPNWPPEPGKDYVPPIQENNKKMGWTPRTPIDNDLKADEKQEKLLRKLGY